MLSSLSPTSTTGASVDESDLISQQRFNNNHSPALATVENFSEAMRKYVISCIDWVNSLFFMASADNVEDKVHLFFIVA